MEHLFRFSLKWPRELLTPIGICLYLFFLQVIMIIHRLLSDLIISMWYYPMFKSELHFNWIFKWPKYLRNCTPFVFASGCAKYVITNSESFTHLRTPRFISMLINFLKMVWCTLGTTYGREHIGFASFFNYKSTGVVLHVPRVASHISSNILRRDRSLSHYSGSIFRQCSVITLFRY